ncbi:MAG TPA: helix-turn-helix domain-containing protein [Planctomycetota bacterium]|nr:helix-turn-helix domain-containing protein [Planctomycetota bacterium]
MQDEKPGAGVNGVASTEPATEGSPQNIAGTGRHTEGDGATAKGGRGTPALQKGAGETPAVPATEQETFFTVEHAASILGCSPRTVRRLIADGWLKGQVGQRSKLDSGKVSEKSLFQLMLADHLSVVPRKHWRALSSERKNFCKSTGQNANAKHLFIDEGTGEAAAPASDLAGEASRQHKRCLHHDFVEQHQFSLGWKARQLAPDDPSFQDDLTQEMSLALLEYGQPASFDFLFELAANRAKMYIRYEIARGMLPLSAARHASDKFAEKMESLQAFIDSLKLRGVPREWIEEVIGPRQDVA